MMNPSRVHSWTLLSLQSQSVSLSSPSSFLEFSSFFALDPCDRTSRKFVTNPIQGFLNLHNETLLPWQHQQRYLCFFLDVNCPWHVHYSHSVQWIWLSQCVIQEPAWYRTAGCRFDYLRQINDVSALLNRCSQPHNRRSYQKLEAIWRKGRIVLWWLSTNPSHFQKWITNADNSCLYQDLFTLLPFSDSESFQKNCHCQRFKIHPNSYVDVL